MLVLLQIFFEHLLFDVINRHVLARPILESVGALLHVWQSVFLNS
ncbi:hypothetical protein BSI_28790 [Bacillus inaquosorum KCTC 13429]|uniref:Uncharacterized protein n=1 Tax=Bacillus inaquosorum KCTC 13429 TaxID=1236548 RepID=A0A9W5LGV6_9BACI|nr:hypothetical protein BSI_28790 [Bacillus inaquosorum KCTC 13429]